jgi:exodeoxyribonuclease VII small subunit
VTVTQSPNPADPATPPPTFEQAVQALEHIIERIESGEIGLEQSIAEYERGVALIRRCREVLDRAEQRVEELTAQMQAGAPPPQPPGR